MEKGKKIILILMILLVALFVISFTINLVLNKKYAVEEIGYTKTNKGLLGIQEIIVADYLEMIYINISYILLLLVLMIIIFKTKKT